MDDYGMNFSDLRKALIRSKERLERNLQQDREAWQYRERRSIETASLVPEENDGGTTQQRSADRRRNAWENEFLENQDNVIPLPNRRLHGRQQENTTSNPGDNTGKGDAITQLPQIERSPLPSWNLSTERLKYISQGMILKHSYLESIC